MEHNLLKAVKKIFLSRSGRVSISQNAKDNVEPYQKMFCVLPSDYKTVSVMLNEAIVDRSDKKLDQVLSLIEHLNVEKQYQVDLAKLLTLPWHHFHDRVAGLLNNDPDDEILQYLYEGALFRCDNLDYESDYCEFNRKCLFALLKNGSIASREYIRRVTKCENKIIADHAAMIIEKYSI